MQHKEWIGSEYKAGIGDRQQKIAIVGNSHWYDEGESDTESATEFVVSKVCDESFNIAFFNHIRNYFGFSNSKEFWHRVIFFNYAPRAIGERDQRYGHLPGVWVNEAKERFVRILKENMPDKIFVFTTKVRWALPSLNSLEAGVIVTGARRGLIELRGVTRPVYLLRHPQGASKAEMTSSVTALMEE